MPEHGAGTPAAFVTLESFLWRDFRDSRDWEAWSKERGLASSERAPRATFDEAMDLQQALRRLEAANNGAPPGDEAIQELNAIIAKFEVRPKLGPSGEIVLAAFGRSRASPVCLLLIMALNAMAKGIWHRFKLCREPSCSASFYDASKSATKVWCSMALCGSRNKMRRLRQRKNS